MGRWYSRRRNNDRYSAFKNRSSKVSSEDIYINLSLYFKELYRSQKGSLGFRVVQELRVFKELFSPNKETLEMVILPLIQKRIEEENLSLIQFLGDLKELRSLSEYMDKITRGGFYGNYDVRLKMLKNNEENERLKNVRKNGSTRHSLDLRFLKNIEDLFRENDKFSHQFMAQILRWNQYVSPFQKNLQETIRVQLDRRAWEEHLTPEEFAEQILRKESRESFMAYWDPVYAGRHRVAISQFSGREMY